MYSEEHIVLVDKNNNVLGTASKQDTHNQNTPLHRGFSVFLFSKGGKLLIQQRSKTKKTWPLIWSNSCCGHPKLNESNIEAAIRRLHYELGISDANIFEIIPDFRYKVELDGIVENEICPILIGFTDQEPTINKDEVNKTEWVVWSKFIKDIKNNQTGYSEWCAKEVNLLKRNKTFLSLLHLKTAI